MTLTNTRFRVLVDDLSYPTDPEVIARLAAGVNLPWGQRHVREVGRGAVVDDLPEVSIPGLIAAGWIEPVAEPPPSRTVRAVRDEPREEVIE